MIPEIKFAPLPDYEEHTFTFKIKYRPQLALSSVQKDRIEFYTKEIDGKEGKELSKKRVDEYRKDDEDGYCQVRRDAIFKILKEDSIKNTKVMAISFFVFAGLGTAIGGGAGGPFGALVGFGAGGGTGLLVGTGIIAHCVNKKIKIQISYSDKFSQWRIQAIKEKIYPLFKLFLKEHKYEKYLCPISGDICNIPMLAPDGHTYDKEWIDKYIARRTDKDDVPVDSLFRNGKFCKNDLIFDVEYMKKIIRKSEKIYHEILKQSDNDIEKYGISAIIQNSKEVMDQTIQQMKEKFEEDYPNALVDGSVTPEKKEEMLQKLLLPYQYEYPKEKKPVQEESCVIF